MAASGKKQVPVYCYQCVAGPDLMKVEVEDGIATRIQSNYELSGSHPGGGRVFGIGESSPTQKPS